jgi:hypothetical protein
MRRKMRKFTLSEVFSIVHRVCDDKSDRDIWEVMLGESEAWQIAKEDALRYFEDFHGPTTIVDMILGGGSVPNPEAVEMRKPRGRPRKKAVEEVSIVEPEETK